MGKEPNYTDEDFAKTELQVEQKKRAAQILKVFLSGFFFFCTGDVGAGWSPSWPIRRCEKNNLPARDTEKRGIKNGQSYMVHGKRGI